MFTKVTKLYEQACVKAEFIRAISVFEVLEKGKYLNDEVEPKDLEFQTMPGLVESLTKLQNLVTEKHELAVEDKTRVNTTYNLRKEVMEMKNAVAKLLSSVEKSCNPWNDAEKRAFGWDGIIIGYSCWEVRWRDCGGRRQDAFCSSSKICVFTMKTRQDSLKDESFEDRFWRVRESCVRTGHWVFYHVALSSARHWHKVLNGYS